MRTAAERKANPDARRYFGGKIDNFADKDERDLEQKHLKAYLKCCTQFRHGYFTTAIGTREPQWYYVQEVWK